ncbi:hypothetical protein FHS16_004940 [Paenibacillus endophyticus]|uniref:Uncharacterized protein n=1 Tax=Paenibacillus endophyticus TaxID=1294268 RepID=A0A7W5CBW4_9BACL|nr:hypothetical protein [Paenibacillus endophyticus]MBB3154858.1 hypothetical protein [Paenibacillus endophyticus]
MAINRRLSTDLDFEEVLEQQQRIRVFQNNQLIDASSLVVRFDDSIIVTQSGVSDIAYHNRKDCEFFVLRKR